MKLINNTPFNQNYEVGEQLGSGQFAVVRRVIHRATGRPCAAKFIKKRRFPNSKRGILMPHIIREIEILQLLKGHPNIIEVLEVFETPNEVILILELVSGGELFEYLDAHDYLEEREAAQFVFQILRALAHCHKKNVAHLDIKPENLMLKGIGGGQEKIVKLIDFGLSRQINPGQIVREMVGTPEFVAPEIINYEPLTTAAGVVFLFRRNPFYFICSAQLGLFSYFQIVGHLVLLRIFCSAEPHLFWDKKAKKRRSTKFRQ